MAIMIYGPRGIDYNNYLDEICKQQVIETDEEIVIRMLKYDFERTVGVSFERFSEIHKNLLDNNPEKLI